MKILVCMKQVPAGTKVDIDPETGAMKRLSGETRTNPYDLFALETALRIKKENNAILKTITMGPPQAKNALKECLGIAADKAYLISGRAFGGSDTLATSYILSCAIKKVAELEGGFDAIFCGKQAIDGDTAQVGPEIAEHLGLPQVTYALEAELTDDGLTILKECEDANQKIAVSLPCLVTFTKPSFDPRYPTIKRKLAANRAEIPVLGEDAFPDIDKTRIGLKGSPTHVKKSFVPPRKQGGVMIKEESNTASAQKLVAMLSEAHLI